MAIRITYNNLDIDLEIAPESLRPNYRQTRFQKQSSSGKIATLSLHGLQEISFDAFFTVSIYYDLIAWWSWARQGKAFKFAFDSGNTGNTTLNGAAASGQKNVPLTATGAFSANDYCLIRAEDADDEYEVVKVGSVDAGVKIIAVANLKYTYASGDTFRHLEYWPSVVSINKEFNPTPSNDIYKWTFQFIENL